MGQSSPNFLAFNLAAFGLLPGGGTPAGPETIVFSGPQNSIQVNAGSTSAGTVTLTCFSNSSVVGSSTIVGSDVLQILSVQGPDITRCTLEFTGSVLVADDLAFGNLPPVPMASKRDSLRSPSSLQLAARCAPGSGDGPRMATATAVSSTADGKSAHPLRALRHTNFRLFFAGQLISLIGTWMQQVAQSWLIYRLTGSSFLLGAVGFASQIPAFLLGPVGGHVADRHDRRRVLVITQSAAMVLAFILAALTLTDRVREWHIFVLASLLGVVNAFDMPTRQAFLVQMVEREDLINAIALNSSMFNGARIVGPAVAGLLVAAIGEGWCFFANGVSYIAVIISLVVMKVPRLALAPMATSALANIMEGLRFVWHTKPIRALLLLLAVVNFTAMPYAVLMPVFADRILHSGARGLGILMGAGGLGALIGSIMLAMRSTVRGLGRWVMVAAAIFGATLLTFGLSRSLVASCAILIACGAAMMVQMASSNTLIQSMVPDELRGRVMAAYTMMFMGSAPIGSLIAGGVADRIGAPLTVVIGGALAVVAAVVFGIHLPSLRGEARQLIIAQQMVGGEPAE